MTQSHELEDQRWTEYRERFHTLPIFCFNDLKFPESYEEAMLQISRLELEQKNIESQFLERETELKAEQPSEESEKEFKKWKTRALRAQRMKFSQIRIIEAWMLDFPPSYEERIKALEFKTEELSQILKKLKLKELSS